MTFDAAGTLFAVAEPVGATYARCAARHGIRLDANPLAETFAAAFHAAPSLAFPGTSGNRLAERERAWWHALVRAAFGGAAAAPGFDACFAELFAHYADGAAWRVFPEVPAVLTALRARGLRLAVVSNFDGRLPGLLAALGLGPRFDAVVYSSRAGAAKPSPAIFAHALATLGVPADAAVHVGDSIDADVGGACAAGLRAVLVDRGVAHGAVPASVAVLPSLAALPALLQQ